MAGIDQSRMADALVGQMYTAGADRGFRSLDVFVTWFVAGTAAAMGLIVANLDHVQGLVAITSIRGALPTLGAALVLVLISKFFGSLICTMAGAMEAAVTLMKNNRDAGIPDVTGDALDAAIERAKPWTMKAWERITRQNIAHTNQGRKAMRLMIASGFCALLAACLTVCFWVTVII